MCCRWASILRQRALVGGVAGAPRRAAWHVVHTTHANITRRAELCTLAAQGPESCSRRRRLRSASRPLLPPAPPRTPSRIPEEARRPPAGRLALYAPFHTERMQTRSNGFFFEAWSWGAMDANFCRPGPGAASACSRVCALVRQCVASIARKCCKRALRLELCADGHWNGRDRRGSQHDVWRGGRKLLGGITSCPALALR